MRTVNEVSKITGVSVRTLHHYDAIGILKPSRFTNAGYRLYDDTALSRLQSILLFRELRFSLKEIKSIIDSPDFDQAKAIEQQIILLEMERDRIEGLIGLAKSLGNDKFTCDKHGYEDEKGGLRNMAFDAFDKSKIEEYKAEAKAKWGATSAYHEYEARDKKGEAFEKANKEMMKYFKKFGEIKELDASAKEAQNLVAELQAFISANYYECTPEILSGLGQMYVDDARFKANIDRAGGIGTAEFVAKAIKNYCDGK